MRSSIEKLSAGHVWKTQVICKDKNDVLNFMVKLPEISHVYLSENFSFNRLNEILKSVEYRITTENNGIYF